MHEFNQKDNDRDLSKIINIIYFVFILQCITVESMLRCKSKVLNERGYKWFSSADLQKQYRRELLNTN